MYDTFVLGTCLGVVDLISAYAVSVLEKLRTLGRTNQTRHIWSNAVGSRETANRMCLRSTIYNLCTVPSDIMALKVKPIMQVPMPRRDALKHLRGASTLQLRGLVPLYNSRIVKLGLQTSDGRARKCLLYPPQLQLQTRQLNRRLTLLSQIIPRSRNGL